MEKSNQDRCIVDGGVAATTERTDSEEKPPPYLKLNADCWEHIFDYLTFHDILTVGQTCRRMNRMAGYYFREYLPQYCFQIEEEIVAEDVCLRTDFYPFISRLNIQWYNEKAVTKFLSNISSFDALKSIEFHQGRLANGQTESMQNALKNVEHIFVNRCKIVDNIFEAIANYCPNLRQIHVVCPKLNDAWFFTEHYPALECCRYWHPRRTPVTQLKKFLETHLKLKEFHTDSEFLWANRDAFMQSNIELDLLSVHLMKSPSELFQELLKELYDRNCYKRLHIDDIANTISEHVSHALSSLPQLTKMGIWENSTLDLGLFTNLTELKNYKFYADTEQLAKGLPKLEHLAIWRTDINTILPLIRYAKKLKTIKIVALDEGYLDLSSLNNERKKLQNACKVAIYVNEDEYLHPKWKSHNFKLELDLVQIARLDTFDTITNFLL